VAFGASAFVPGSIEAALARPRPEPPPDGAVFTRRAFESQRNRLFRVQDEATGAVLRLMQVSDPLSAGAAGTAGSEKCFSLVFRGPRSRRLEQGTYTVRNSRFGTFEIFLVPVGRPGAWMSYEASYNLI
jgi:hypothetical protein